MSSSVLSLCCIFVMIIVANGEDLYTCGANHELFNELMMERLPESGYVSQEGMFFFHPNQSMYCANPSLYYGLSQFPRNYSALIPDNHTYEFNGFNFNDHYETYDSAPIGSARHHEDLNATSPIHGTGAIIWYGCLAPSQYYSHQMYIRRRWNPLHPSLNDTQIDNTKYPSSHPYGSVGAMYNRYNINRTVSGLIVVVFTPDNKTYTDIVNLLSPHLTQLNLTNINQINLNLMPYQNVPVNGPGFGPDKNTINMHYLKYRNAGDGWIKQIINREPLDMFTIMFRFGLPFKNATINGDINRYIATKQTLYKVYYNNTQHLEIPRQPFAAPYLVNTSTGRYEADTLQPYFTQYVNSVYEYFNVKYPRKYYLQYVSTKMNRPGYMGNTVDGYACIKYSTRCMGDNRDCTYFLGWPDVEQMTNTSIFFFIGVIHTDTGHAEWENMVPMFETSGIGDRFYRSHYLDYMTDKYRYSAMTFPPNINKTIPQNVLNKFFILAAMRPDMCAKYFDNHEKYPELKDIPKMCFDNNDWPYNTSENWFMIQRDYLDPHTHTQPSYNEMIPLMSVKFEEEWYNFNEA
eukprot:78592_1